MRATFFGLEIGKTGLTTAQFGLDTTGHNIANVDTAGYTRQRIVQTAIDPFATIGKFAPMGQGLVGGGTRVQILDQIRSAYLDRRFRTESTNHEYWSTRSQSLSYIRSFFDNVNEKTSINYSLAEFFKSMKIFSEDPVSGAPRTLMQTAAMDLVQQINMIQSGLIDLQRNENRVIETKVAEINRIAEGIADLNTAIYGFEITGMIANDLRDKRQLLVDQLAEFVDIEYRDIPEFDKEGNPLNASIFEIKVAGVTLVHHDFTNELRVRETANNIPGEAPVFDVYWFAGDNNRPLDGESLSWNSLTGGQLKAHRDVRDGIGQSSNSIDRGIPYYVEMMNNLARALVSEINEVHRQGWSNHPNGSQNGINFFHEDSTWFNYINPNGITLEWNEEHNRWQNFDGSLWIQEVAGALVDQDGVAVDDTNYNHVLDLSKITARNLRLDQRIIDNAFNIAASSERIGRAGEGDSEELQAGNNENINRLYQIFTKTNIRIMVNGQERDIGGFDDYGTVIRFDLANTLHTAEQMAETARLLTLAANNQRTAIAGVSLDEEMVSLVKYQHAYSGASRVITVMDDMLDRLINGTGRVGL